MCAITLDIAAGARARGLSDGAIPCTLAIRTHFVAVTRHATFATMSAVTSDIPAGPGTFDEPRVTTSLTTPLRADLARCACEPACATIEELALQIPAVASAVVLTDGASRSADSIRADLAISASFPAFATM